MNETIVAIVVVVSSLLLTLVDHNFAYIFEFVVISLVGYVTGRLTQRMKSKENEGRKRHARDPPEP